MYPYITCHCGNDLGSLWPLFAAMRAAHLRDKFDVADPAVIQLSHDMQTALGPILDAIGCTRVCCRTKLLTQKLFKDVY